MRGDEASRTHAGRDVCGCAVTPREPMTSGEAEDVFPGVSPRPHHEASPGAVTSSQEFRLAHGCPGLRMRGDEASRTTTPGKPRTSSQEFRLAHGCPGLQMRGDEASRTTTLTSPPEFRLAHGCPGLQMRGDEASRTTTLGKPRTSSQEFRLAHGCPGLQMRSDEASRTTTVGRTAIMPGILLGVLLSWGVGCGTVGDLIAPEDIGIEAKVRARQRADALRTTPQGQQPVAVREKPDVTLPPLQPMDAQ